MKAYYFIVVAMFLSTLAACRHDNVREENIVSDAPKVTGILGLDVSELVEERKYFDPAPVANYFYGQLFIKTNLYRASVSGPDARSLSSYVVSLFGSEKKQFGITVVPKLNGVKLPEVLLFSYMYDSASGVWQSKLGSRYSSPAFPVSDFSKVEFDFKYVASDSVDLDLAEIISELILNNAELLPGAWVISSASASKVTSVSNSLDSVVSKMLSKSVTAEVSDQMEPAVDGGREITYRVGGKDKIADIVFSTRIFTSLVSGSRVNKFSTSSDYSASVPLVEPHTNPLNKIRKSGGSEITLNDDLKRRGLLSGLADNNPDEFSNKCRDLVNELQGAYGLTVFDSLNSMRFVLQSTKFLRDRTLYDSGCLSSAEFKLLEDMGVPLPFEKDLAVTPLDDVILKKIAGYMKTPIGNNGFEGDIRNLFSSSGVRVASVPAKFKSFPKDLDFHFRNDIVQQLSHLRVATTCCWGKSVLDGGGEPMANTAQIYFRSLDYKNLYALELFQKGKGEAVDFIRLRELSEGEISADLEKYLMSPASPLVNGAGSDVVLSAGI